MPINFDNQTELDEARALTEATLIALDRFGHRLSHEDLKRLVACLEQANELLKRYNAKRRPTDLIAAITAIDQIRQFLIEHAPH